jgi:2-polyprenyl-3-methyl-5-hydroxy-6-metoxy-1,4-benzoquinol methylase
LGEGFSVCSLEHKGGLKLAKTIEDLKKDVLSNSQYASQTGQYYDERWKKILKDEWRGSKGYGKLRVNAIESMITDFVKPSNLKILDLGCGIGWLSKCLCQFGEVTGIDFSPETIAVAQETYKDFGHFVLADPSSETLGLPSYHDFDIVVSSEVIEHALDHGAFLAQINNFLRPGGWLILTTPNQAVYKDCIADPRSHQYLQPVENWLLPSDLAHLLEKHGYTTYRHEGFRLSSDYGYNLPSRMFGRSAINRVVNKFHLQHWYGRMILPFSLYQFLIAKKCGIS